MLKKFLILFFFAGISPYLYGQEIKIFKIEDFDLRGNVESCLVITDYGKEEYYFDKMGRLTKSVTRFNDSDYETTYYKYVNNELVERRVENYLDDTFDNATSLANFYSIDTTANRKVIEKIVSYEKELLEQNIYFYGKEGKLTRIAHTDTNGTDENTFTYMETENETSVTQKRNGVVSETIQTTLSVSKIDSLQKTVLTQKYLDGQLYTKTVEVFDDDQKLLSHNSALYDSSTEKWILQEDLTYGYTENGVLDNVKSKRRGFTTTKEYIYQFDGTEANNWVKEIVTPENTYTTRRISYYELPEADEPQKE
mgnify:CR=1 FL=1